MTMAVTEAGRPAFGRRDPDARGYFGPFGGRFVPETLVAPLAALENAYLTARTDPAFVDEYRRLLRDYVGRPTPLTEAARIGAQLGGTRVLLKREDLAHTGAHKINNALGQALLARRMGKRRIVAETGAGQHGVATATVCALLDLDCVVYMGTDDMERQALNVFRMRLLGATVAGVDAGSRTLKDAINEAMRDWVANIADTHYLLGSALGPHPYPLMVREFQSVIGDEARAQCVALAGRLPDVVVACVGGGSNALGLFDAFIADPAVRLIGIEAGGEAILAGRHAARFAGGSPGILQGTRTFILQDEAGNITLTHSVSAGLDYAAIGPEHAWLRECGRATYEHVSDSEALDAFEWLARTEGILPALESAHAFAPLAGLARGLGPGGLILVNLSGRGDKDVHTVAKALAARGGASAAEASRVLTGGRV
jgi:tryptophan synthase beta chain